jgi:hypothetical protein
MAPQVTLVVAVVPQEAEAEVLVQLVVIPLQQAVAVQVAQELLHQLQVVQ